MLAASGVVVNDSLVLLDYIHQRQDSAKSLQGLITEACAARFRPLLLTFLTNFAGFFPILLDTSEQVQFLVPMVVALAFGLLFGMVATLVAVPASYAALDDVQYLSQLKQRRFWQGANRIADAREREITIK
jgi:multidrug efflux pump subunit AcrB